MTLDANKALIRRLFEEVLPAGDPVAARDLLAPEYFDHNPLPGQWAGAEGIEYVVSTLHAAWRDLRFSVDDLVPRKIGSRSDGTLRGMSIVPMFGRPPSGGPAEQAAIAIFRIAGGKIVERWASFSPAGQGRPQVPPPRA